jgi:signal transduction histidine kinase
MTRRRFAAHRRLVVEGALAVWACGQVAFLTLIVVYDLDFFGPLGGPWVLSFGAFTITGAVIAWQRPGHVIGILFLVLGVSAPVANTLAALAMGPFAEHSLHLRTLFTAGSVASTTVVFPLMLVAIMRFPDGALLSPRWRWSTWVTCATMGIGAVAAFAAGAWGGDPEQVILGPPLDGRLSGIAEVLSPVYFLLITVLLTATAVSAVLRYRRSQSIARQQMKWLALAVLFLVVIAAGVIVTRGALATPPGTPSVVFAVGVAFVPISAAIAILRHRLYDIDIVLNRTIVFGLLAAFITALYAMVVVGIGSLIGDRSNLVLTVGTTAMVAAAFEPVRARVQHWANVAVYGHRATPYEVLATVTAEIGSAATDGGPQEAMAALLADGTGAQHATVWVHADGHLRAAACWPVHDPDEHPVVVVEEGALEQLPGTAHSEPVRQDGNLLGALTLERGRDEPITPQERQLVGEMAGQAALMLANAQLRMRLRARLDELRSSRQRLVAAQDEARRKLERDLHDGAQQQLVALKVKLGLARTIAGRDDVGAPVMQLLAGLSVAADEAVDALRSLARGIYPPLLEAEGLERAITTQAQKAPLPVLVRAEGLRRYDRQVEATVYFCVLEALNNALKHAEATALSVVLNDEGGRLTFQVSDDGRGFEPDAVAHGLGLTNIADRVDALGGSVAIESTPRGGAQVVGSIPVTEPARTAPGAHAPAVVAMT